MVYVKDHKTLSKCKSKLQGETLLYYTDGYKPENRYPAKAGKGLRHPLYTVGDGTKCCCCSGRQPSAPLEDNT